jgi:precorrin-6B C5,15-methyltransferase / cobalt-precorrin-6B C5,C15-methyltransferase
VNGARIVVVGIGADGWNGLSDAGRAAILNADKVIGSARQLETLPPQSPPAQAWPSPIGPLVDELVEQTQGHVCVLASGDPMLHGIGATLASRLEHATPESRPELEVISHPSAFTLACARLGWPAADVELVSTVGRPVDAVIRLLQPGRRAIIYATGAEGATEIAQVVNGSGYGPSRFVVLEQLGGAAERITESTAAAWDGRQVDPLHAIAIECLPESQTPLLPLVPGLPDDAFEHDGALTKRHVRAATLAALAPTPRALLWDVGAGSGSIAIEWLRAEPTSRAIAVEAREDRAERIARNALKLGVPSLEVIIGSAPDVLADLDRPDAVFIGGGLTSGVLDAAWAALCPGGRLVANAVTIEGEQLLVAAAKAHGGELTKLSVSHAEPLGGFTGWRPALPVVIWAARKGNGSEP